jgi:energy-coupling factor transporter ATP-binding protein EcfA2
MDSMASPKSGDQRVPIDATPPAAALGELVLEVERLSFRYPNGQQAFKDVSLAIHAGEIVGLIGPNGAGKTSLLMHLNGLLPGEAEQASRRATNGKADVDAVNVIRVAGLPVEKRHFAEIRRLVGLLFQDPDDQLFCPTVLEDVAFGPLNLNLTRAEVLSRVAECLAAVGLAGFEQRGTQRLSYGERKRVCLAGVMACRPSLLALDEPTSNLDPRARRQFIAILKSYPAAQLIASHDLELIREICTRVIVLDQGQVRADGPTEKILADERLLERHGLEVPLSIRYGVPRTPPAPGPPSTNA